MNPRVPLANMNARVGVLIGCKERGKEVSIKPSPSIYMVPGSLRDLSPTSFKPRVVSIGPLHREDKLLQNFEEQKTEYLYRLLDRLLDRLELQPRQILEGCLRKVDASIDRIRECYAGMNRYTDSQLAEMMVIDACFILEFLYGSIAKEAENLIRGNVILVNSIFHDLLLLENQIPYFVLKIIFDCTLSLLQPKTLASIVLGSLEFLLPFRVITYNDDSTNPHHILGLVQKSFRPTDRVTISTRPSLPELCNHSVVELSKAGVVFKPNEKRNGEITIEPMSACFPCFRANLTLRMPVLCIYDNTELFLRNAIAYEQCTPNVPNYVTSYACAMDFLVEDAEDVLKLVESKIIVNTLGSNEIASDMLNSISKQVVFSEFYYLDEWQQLDKHYNGYWPKRIAQFKRKYFNSPWSLIALIGGLILFALTIVQTIYTIKAVRI